MRALLLVPAMIMVGVGALGCHAGPSEDLIFVDGRAVASSGDSLLVVTRPDTAGLVVLDRRTGAVYVRAVNILFGPQHVQANGDRWYVSDMRAGRFEIAVLDHDWQLDRRITVGSRAAAPHQFAVLPDGRIIIETPDGRLGVLTSDTVQTFALSEQSTRTGFLIAALGGVIHAVPDRSLTLYNGLGNVRWRLPWPWHAGAYVTDLCVDARGRIHVLAGEGDGYPSFVAFTLSAVTGEVIRWSVPAPTATFSANRVGQIKTDDPKRWFGGG